MPERPRKEWELDEELRQLLVCPACRGELRDEAQGLHCPACALLYPVELGIPHMIAEEAKPFPSSD